jgi:putative hemolysin
VAGFVMAELGRLPKVGDVVVHDGVRLTVVRIEGRRVARVRVTPRPAPEPVDKA